MRTRQERRYNSYKKAKRKELLLRETRGWDDEMLTDTVKGKLNKGKVHCSCKMCQAFREFEGTRRKIREDIKYREQLKDVSW